MESFITLPTTTIPELTAYVSGLFGDLWPIIALTMGVPLAFYVIGKVISVVKSKVK